MSAKTVPRIERPLQTWANDTLPPFTEEDALYPSSDGLPMSDSTWQWDWIVLLKICLDWQYRDDPNVFIAADHFWYPVEGRPDIRSAPDTMVVFGRPKGHRYSYRQWREAGVAPQVVFEIFSHSNPPSDRETKRAFYDRYGVEEYYTYDPRPERLVLEGWLRRGSALTPIAALEGWVSPRLSVKFERVDGELKLYHPSDLQFLEYTELRDLCARADQRALAARAASRQTESAQTTHAAERAAKEAAWAKLRAMGIDPESL